MQHARGDGSTGARDASQFLTFALGNEAYGIEILRIQEIKGYTSITPIPNAPTHIKGVMNLRGTVVPILDLRVKLGMAAVPYDRFSVIVVVNVRSRIMGLIVDQVSDVLDLPESEIELPPALGARADVPIIRGIARSGERLIALLDIARVVGEESDAAA